MILKIISGGQTGVDRGALDTAIKLGVPHGGWLPRGRKTEDGRLPDHYDLQELASTDYRERTECNVRDADGTLIISPDPLSGGSAYTRQMAEQYAKPWLHINPAAAGEFAAARTAYDWIAEKGIEVLNVAGPRSSKEPGIYATTCRLLESVFYLDMMQSAAAPGGFAATWNRSGASGQPATVADAVAQLVDSLPLRERTVIAGTGGHEWQQLRAGIVDGLKRAFYLDRGNQALMADCRRASGNQALDSDGAAGVLMETLRQELRRTHLLRRVK
ncbi:MAG: putative molybdenum carrier protein [Pseudomonadota bacterium]